MANMATPRSELYRLADEKLRGHLCEIIDALYARDQSWRRVSSDLYALHGVRVSDRTLAAWAERLGIQPTTEEREAS